MYWPAFPSITKNCSKPISVPWLISSTSISGPTSSRICCTRKLSSQMNSLDVHKMSAPESSGVSSFGKSVIGEILLETLSEQSLEDGSSNSLLGVLPLLSSKSITSLSLLIIPSEHGWFCEKKNKNNNKKKKPVLSLMSMTIIIRDEQWCEYSKIN